jgi:hypothetical protein
MRWSRGGRSLPLLLLLVLSACSLEEIVYLVPPSFYDTGGAATGGTIGLVHDTNTNTTANFQGYQILYHLYDKAEDATKAQASLATLAASTQSPDTVFATLQGTNYNFRTLEFKPSDGSASVDTLPISQAEILTSVNYFLRTSDWRCTKSSGTLSYVAYRNNQAGGTAIAAKNLTVQDQDYTGASSSPSTAYMVLCAVALAVDSNTFLGFVHSMPAVLSTADSTTNYIVIN